MKRNPTGFIKGPKKFWPAWRYSVSNPEGRIFQKPEDVPEGYFPTLAEAQKAAEVVDEAPAPAPAPAAPLKAPKKGKAKDDPRAQKIAKLKDAGYDPTELANASDAELDAALKANPDAAN